MKRFILVENEGTLTQRLLRYAVVKGRRYPFVLLKGSLRFLTKKIKKKGFPEYYQINPLS